MRNTFRLVTGAITGLALMSFSLPSASAFEQAPTPTSTVESPQDDAGLVLSPQDLDAIHPDASNMMQVDTFIEGLRELEASELAREAAQDGTHAGFTYTVDIPEGSIEGYTEDTFQMTLPTAAAVEAAVAAKQAEVEAGNDRIGTRVSVRLNGQYVAIGFNTLEQQMLASGSTTLLVAAICAVPAVGWVACAIVGVVVAVATTYVTRNGVCSNKRTLWWYDSPKGGGSTIQCRSSAPW